MGGGFFQARFVDIGPGDLDWGLSLELGFRFLRFRVGI